MTDRTEEPKLLVEIYLHTQALIAKYSRGEFIEASMIADDLIKHIENAKTYIAEKLNLEE